MVPDDDEHKRANESEEDTSTQSTFLEKFKFWKRDKKDANEPARLKTLPEYLMHWTTPVWIAAAGFLIALAFAVNWHGTFHWPSADAMKLCATIAGAGFAFSAWQQRSHDNAVREQDKLRQEQAESRAREDREKQRNLDETRRLEQIERDEYWKRREHIFQLLGSKNPGLRLGAVALMAELADRAKHSTLLSNIENQQLQQHIIATLCSQLRHEGLAHETEGSIEEHASIQEEILNQLAKRIHEQETHSSLANWRICNIDLSHTTFHTPFALANLNTEQNIDISHSIFREPVHFTNSRLLNLKWSHAIFQKSLYVLLSELHIDLFPAEMKSANFSNTTLSSRLNREDATITLTLTNAKSRLDDTNKITFDQDCVFTSPLTILTSSDTKEPNFSSEHIEFQNCSFTTIKITGSTFNADLQFEMCTFENSLKIHALTYELGSVLTHDCEECDPSCYGEWESEFPEHTMLRTASILFSNCIFPNEITEGISIKEILCYYMQHEVRNDDLISLINNRTFSGEEIVISWAESCVESGSSYIAKIHA